MPKHERQKEKLLLLRRIFETQTDERHPLPAAALLQKLEEEGVAAERKSIYADIEALRASGLEIELQRGPGGGYYLADRPFQLAEVKLLVDAVQASRFITRKKSGELIKKLQGLCSRYEARSLARQVYVAGRVKSMNESIYYNIDALHAAIAEDKQICFCYFHWEVDFSSPGAVRECYHRDGGRYTVSPFALLIDDGNYYLVGYDGEAGGLRHYRVDKMTRIALLEEKRQGKDLLAHFDPAAYTKAVFGMFSGRAGQVKLQVENRLVGVVLDRFGRDVTLLPGPKGYFCVNVNAVPSPQFLSFVAGFGAGMRILEPAALAEEMRALARQIAALYEEE